MIDRARNPNHPRDGHMPRYIIEREIGAFDANDVLARGQELAEIVDQMDDVVWIRSYLSETEGKVYCEYDAPDPETIYEHARRAGIPVTRISVVAMEIEPSMFR